jgi:predicted DNA-binding transcriptional regulator YafY
MAKKATKGTRPQAEKAGKGHPITTRPDRDRRVRQNARVARILSVLNLIQSRGRWTARAIAEELESSERTVYRDLQVLEFAGVPWYRDPSDHTIRVRPDFRFPVLMLTDDELLGQAVATALTKAPGLNVTLGATPTTRKLAATSNEKAQQLLDDASRLIEVLDLKIADHSRHHDVLKTVQTALLRQRQLTGHYESPYEPAPVKLQIHPFRLCLIKNAWYVIGRPVDASEPRTYRVARFKSLRMLEEKADIPQDFDLRAYFGNAWSVYRGPKSYDVEIWFTPEAARVVTETVWHHSQKSTFHNDGSVTLTFHVDGLQEIANWVMAWTGRAKVIQPAELRSLIIDKLTTALKMHQE